ncbi:MAG: hypothetical protein ACOYJH_04875 [Anaerovoracaceae bacterium]
MKFNKRIGKIAAVLTSAAICISMTAQPAFAYTGVTEEKLSNEWSEAISSEKTIDLSDSGLDVSLTEDEKNELKQQAEDEYDSVVADTFSEVTSNYSESDPNTDDSDYKTTLSENIQNAEDEEALYEAVTSGMTDPSEMAVYLRYWLASNFSSYNGDSEGGDSTVSEGYPSYLFGNVGSSDWYNNVYKFFTVSSDDADVNATAARFRSHYVDQRYSQLLSERLNEKLQGLLDVQFDFNIAAMTDAEWAVYGTGDYAERGKLKNGLTETHFSTVDFGASDQYYDIALYDMLSRIQSGEYNNRNELSTFVGDYSIVSHLILWDDASYEKKPDENDTTGYRIGGVTKDDYSIWPYYSEAQYSAGEDWEKTRLADDAVLKASSESGVIGLTGEMPEYYSWSVYDSLASVPGSSMTRSGKNLFRPTFDSNGKLVAVSKPLMNGLISLDNYRGIVDDDGNEITYTSSDSYGFDRDEVLDQLEDPESTTTIAHQLDSSVTTSVSVLRYLLKEKATNATINGKTVKTSSTPKIVDVITVYDSDGNAAVSQIMVFDSTDAADSAEEEYFSGYAGTQHEDDVYADPDAIFIYGVKYAAEVINTVSDTDNPDDSTPGGKSAKSTGEESTGTTASSKDYSPETGDSDQAEAGMLMLAISASAVAAALARRRRAR